jgi:hypothetical protein
MLLGTSAPGPSSGSQVSPSTTMMDGTYAMAFLSAYSDFRTLSILSPDEKKLERYRIHFKSDGQYTNVAFVPKFPPGWFGVGGQTPYGRTVVYSVQRQTNVVVKRQFEE